MKIFVIISALLVVAFVLLQSFTLMSSNKTEEQKYTVVLKEKDFEIRFYPSATVATVHSSAKSYKELSGPGFRKLAGYIFGGNERNTSISMTAPVHMDINDSVSSMSFVMPSVYNADNLPKPNDPSVFIQRTPDRYVAVFQFGGYASDQKLRMYTEKLYGILAEKGITAYGHASYLGYNPPYQLVNRRNEVVVTIKWDGAIIRQ